MLRAWTWWSVNKWVHLSLYFKVCRVGALFTDKCGSNTRRSKSDNDLQCQHKADSDAINVNTLVLTLPVVCGHLNYTSLPRCHSYMVWCALSLAGACRRASMFLLMIARGTSQELYSTKSTITTLAPGVPLGRPFSQLANTWLVGMARFTSRLPHKCLVR